MRLAAAGAVVFLCTLPLQDRTETQFPVEQGEPFAESPMLIGHDGALRATLKLTERKVEIAGKMIRAKTYNGQFPGPTMVISPGDRIRLRFVNRLDEPTNIHFHGFHASPSGIADNVLRRIRPHSNAKVVVAVPDDMAPGTYWYHSHEHGSAEEQVFSGLSGAIIVRGLEDRLPVGLRGVEQRVLALKDLQVKRGAIVTKNIDSNAPTTRTVNGLVDPVLDIAPGQTQMWRLANISADIWYRLRFDGGPFNVIAEDANPVARVWRSKSLLLPPGKRYDVLVHGPDAGDYALRTLAYSTGPAGDSYPERTLATVRSTGPPVTPIASPSGLGPKPRLGQARIDRRRHLVFSDSANGNRFFINGKQFEHHVVNVRAELGDLEEWVISNVSGERHPFHIHVDDFQVISINGRRYHARSLQDTQALPVHGKIVIRLRFSDYAGEFVYHCHILAHEDAGMMGLIKVGRPGGHGGHGGHCRRAQCRRRQNGS